MTPTLGITRSEKSPYRASQEVEMTIRYTTWQENAKLLEKQVEAQRALSKSPFALAANARLRAYYQHKVVRYRHPYC